MEEATKTGRTKDCIDPEECENRMRALEKDCDNLLNPISGVISHLHDKVNNKLSIAWGLAVLTMLVSIIAGSFIFTENKATSNRTVIDDHSRLISSMPNKEDLKDLKEEIKYLRQEMKEFRNGRQ